MSFITKKVESNPLYGMKCDERKPEEKKIDNTQRIGNYLGHTSKVINLRFQAHLEPNKKPSKQQSI